MNLSFLKFKPSQFSIIQLVLLSCFGWLMSSHSHAEPPRVLHTTFEQYAKQQQQHDQQLMANQSKAPSATKTNLTNNTPVASKLSGFKASGSKASAKPSSPKTNASPININQADEFGLSAALIGVGPAKAKAIVEYRKQNGAFKRVDDLVLVKGIGPATLEKNRDRLRLN